MKILINNNICRVDCDLKTHLKLTDLFKVRHPNAFHLRRYMPKGWDGKVPFYKEGRISTGLLPQLLQEIHKLGIAYTLDDVRDIVKPGKIPNKLGPFIIREYQKQAINSVVNNYEGDVYFPRGIIKAATNSGKNIIICGIYKAFNLPTFVVMNNKEMFETSLEECGKLLPGKVGWITSKEIVWNDFMLCMVKTTHNRVKQLKHKLSNYQVAIVDECDLSDNKTNKKVISELFNAVVRVGLSGTVALSNLKKDLIKNQNIKSYFGEVLYSISNAELIEKGFSSKVVIKILPGNQIEELGNSYSEAYDRGIINNRDRNKKVIKRIKYHLNKGRVPILIIAKRHKHILNIYKLAKKLLPDFQIEYVHHRTLDRKDIIRRFKEGKIDILIGSKILGRAKNFPLIQYMANAAGGLAPEDVLQFLGRATRKHSSKKITYYEDFHDKGKYLSRHARARERYYRNEKIRVIKKY